MSSRFRSEEMAFCQLYLQSEAGYECLSELGELNLVQFKDVNPKANAFERKFINEVLRCDEMERKLSYVEAEIVKNGIPILGSDENPKAPHPREIDDLAAEFDKSEIDLRKSSHNIEFLKGIYLELVEIKHILKKTQVFFEKMTVNLDQDDERVMLLGTESFKFIAGVIIREKIPSFEQMLWRACCGTVLLRQIEIEIPLEDPSTGNPVHKSVFIIFYRGEPIKSRILKICEGFHGTVYPCPDTPFERQKMISEVSMRVEEVNIVLFETNNQHYRALVFAARNIKNWSVKVIKIKTIYHALNLFNSAVTKKYLISECWIPLLHIEIVQLAMQRATERTGCSLPPVLIRTFTSDIPPTFNRTNKFSSAFQELVNAYGIASYGEINPMPFTVISFPFLFAVMFGDMGHGFLLFLFAIFMVLNEKSLAASKSDNEIWKILFAGRYVILLMGLFSMYTGLIYNDIFSKSLNVFGSHWHTNYNESTVLSNKHLQLNPSSAYEFDRIPYSMGLDPVWQLASNKINFMNAFKMKMSIIIGVLHMMTGLGLRWCNYRYFNDKISVYLIFIPQFIFLTFMIFYLVLLMFIKWVSYGAENDTPKSLACAPSILVTYIGMILFKDTSPLDHCDTVFMFPHQNTVQDILVFVAVLCIPIMMFAKPIVVLRQKLQSHGHTDSVGKDDKIDIGQLFIDESIETIEYVLGTVSHTASYLRLWALSLAHAQLSDVLWKMVLAKGLLLHSWFGGIWMYVFFAAWAILTVGVLVLMEGLSAFLHTLRLHWVEFQSKFYSGRGYAFTPFSFEVALNK